MSKYVKVDWPESQKWEDVEGTIVAWDEDNTFVFVPEELYNGFFEVTAVSRDDLKAAGFDAEGVTDETMRRLASDLGDALVADGFWPALEIIAEGLGIKREEE